MYKLIKNPYNQKIEVVQKQVGNILMSIPFASNNTDYTNFKREINEDEAELQDADGKLMSADAAKAFVATLP